ncbi:Pvc16 family protein [Candidatus Zixiibacteriota bacterium]
MLTHLDNLIRQLLLAEVAELTHETQVRFQPPDDDWRSVVANPEGESPEIAVNVYLADLRENRKLRSNARENSYENKTGNILAEPAPARLDCHYLISVWSPAARPQFEPTLEEHALLYKITEVLMRQGPFNPSRIYPAGSAALNAWPEPFRDVELPAVVAPAEGFNKLAEFWSGMGTNSRWKPALYLIVTLPVALVTEVAGPMVTTRITEYRMLGTSATAEVFCEIGGRVLDTTHPLPNGDPAPVVGAWVQLQTEDGAPLQTTTTTEKEPAGRFTFVYLRPGKYRLQWRADGFAERPPSIIEIPSPSGEYDLKF